MCLFGKVFLELLYHGYRALGQNNAVGHRDHQLISTVKQRLGGGIVAGDGAKELSGRKNLFLDAGNGSLHFGMLGISRMSHRGRQICGANENAVKSVDLQHLVQLVNGLRRLQGDIDENLIVGSLQIFVSGGAVSVGTGAEGNAADPLRGIQAGGYGLSGLLCGVDVWDMNAPCANVQNTLDCNKVIPGRTNDGCTAVAVHGLQLGDQQTDVPRAVFQSTRTKSRPERAKISVEEVLESCPHALSIFSPFFKRSLNSFLKSFPIGSNILKSAKSVYKFFSSQSK